MATARPDRRLARPSTRQLGRSPLRRLMFVGTTTAAGVVLSVLGGCVQADASSRVLVLDVADTPVADAPAPPTQLGAGDALGQQLHEVILARTAGGETYAGVANSPDVR